MLGKSKEEGLCTTMAGVRKLDRNNHHIPFDRNMVKIPKPTEKMGTGW